MAAARFYSSTSGAMNLMGDVTDADTSLTVDSVAGLPGTRPFALVLDPGTASEEIVDVTNASGTTLTVTRGVDGSSAQAHAAGVGNVRHMATARDFREAQEHIGASAAVHGIAGSVVGTSDVQTLTNKTLTAPAIGGTAVATGDVQVKEGADAVFVAGGASTRATYGASVRVKQQTADKSALSVQHNDSNSAALLTVENTGGDADLTNAQVASFAWNSGADAVELRVGGTPSTKAVQVLKGGTESAAVDKNGNITANSVTAPSGTFTAAVSSPTIDGLQAADASLGTRISTLEADKSNGRFTGTTDAQGNINIPHGLGVVPSSAQLSGETDGAGVFVPMLYRTGTTTSHVAVVCYRVDGSRLASTTATVNWVAYR
jgi:hypothetical protein